MNFAIEALRRGIIMRRKPIPWEITWFPTFTCNLKCGYCCVPHENVQEPRPEEACRQIIDLKPASVSILGGEPYLIREMPDYLRRIREALPRTYIIITTNAIVQQKRMLDSAPYLDVMCVSVDGLGEYNKVPRGVTPERILENTWAYNEERKKHEGTHDLCINTVVTSDNADHLPEFIQYIHDKDPSVYIMCQAMHPFDAPNSLANHPDLTDRFIHRVAKQKEEGVRVFLVGQLADEHTRRKGEKVEAASDEEIQHRFEPGSLHTCHKEKFTVMIMPHGALHTCRSYATTNSLRDRLRDDIRNRRILQAARRYFGVWRDLVLRPMDFECGFFTGCPEWCEDIMNTKDGDELPDEIDRVRGRLPTDAVRRSTEFIQSKVNPHFRESVLTDSNRG
jgi:MoaA/NifB/PqqE/SkfB family radical SAM enzyme